MRALRAERVQLIARLQNDHALTAHRDDDKLVLLEFGRFIASQMRRPRRPGLRQRFKITNDWVSDADQPAEEARAQKKIEEMAARRYRSRGSPRSFIARFFYSPPNLFQVFTPVQAFVRWREQELRPAIAVTTNIYECLRRLCDYRARRAQPNPGRAQDLRPRTRQPRWSFGSHRQPRRPIC